ncbi:OST-HTH/LOTUS domain-containing protein [Campylobacter upsaliensis]|nr:OST-HTH/LOTUS domain-containing protein [Campylobacter upsaliensis]
MIKEKNHTEYAQISLMMERKYPDFNPQNYGCPSFRKLMDKFVKDKNHR